MPTRPQPDTVVAIFILKKFGDTLFPGVKDARVEFWQVIPEGKTAESLLAQGYILIDLGGGMFDHHASAQKTTASELIARHLGVLERPTLGKLLEYARRDDFYGKGTISDDPIDRAFGLSALIANLNKSLIKNPERVIEIVMPMIIAHYNEEERRLISLPKKFEDLRSHGATREFDVKQRGKKLKIIMLESDNGSFAGYLRSQQGGRYDVVVQRLPSGHVNILTRPTKRVDLRSLAALLRVEEAMVRGIDLDMDVSKLSRTARLEEIPEWYYDRATNSIQNGGLNPKEIRPTGIAWSNLSRILELGLSEEVWSPTAATSWSET